MVAKASHIATIRTKANQDLQRFKQSYVQEQNGARDKLHQQVFGLGFVAGATAAEQHTARISYRDAIFRADALSKPEAALSMLGRARMIVATLLARAVVCQL